jgi:plasmid stability protein
MANLTITLDDELLRRARLRAQEQGTSVNAVLRDYLADYIAVGSACQQAADEILRLSSQSRSGRGDCRWTRVELHER